MCEDGYYSATDQDSCIKCGDNNENTAGQTGSESPDACGNFHHFVSAVLIFIVIRPQKLGAYRHQILNQY